MTTPANEGTPSANDLDQVIAGYLQAIENGEVPDRAALLQLHLSRSEALRAFFADLDRMDRVASPLRMEDDPTIDHTNESGEASPPRIRYFGDYELIEAIAKGGMGIVYKARQVSLNRVVAIKMILTGTFATERELQRFRSEAENAASLDHPNIVPIYEVGEHEGQQYFSMKFIDGSPLNESPRGSIKGEVERMVTIARAVSFAHQRGILHRDLKPSNILIGNDGAPHVADFGLAKRMESRDHSLTDTGQIIGTPRYMPPEQASGAKTLTTAADVYSLGAILYERLAGCPAFPGDNTMAILDAVRNTTPTPIATQKPEIDRDLATLVHKTLEKVPTHRYPTSSDFADDLERWLKGEPITARPVSQAEHFRRWCRRNPALAAAGGLAAVGLMMATIMSIAFAVQSQKRARAEKERANVARKAEEAAIQATETTEDLLARGLVRSLNPEGWNDLPLSPPELESMWELAQIEEKRVGQRLLDEACRDPLMLDQLYARAEPAMIAAIGLNDEARLKAITKIDSFLQDENRSIDDRGQVAAIGLELMEQSSTFSDPIRTTLQSVLKTDRSTQVRGCLKLRFDQEDQNFMCSNDWGTLRTKFPLEAALILQNSIANNENNAIRCKQALTLAIVSDQIDSIVAQKLCGLANESLVEALKHTKDSEEQNRLLGAITALSERQKYDEAKRVRGEALNTIVNTRINRSRENASSRFRNSERELKTCISKMDPQEAMEACGSGARSLFTRMEEKLDEYQSQPLLDCLLVLAEAMDSAESTHMLIEMARREMDVYNLMVLAECLKTVTSGLESKMAHRASSEMSDILIRRLANENNTEARIGIAFLLDSLTEQRSSTEISRAVGEISDKLRASIVAEKNYELRNDHVVELSSLNLTARSNLVVSVLIDSMSMNDLEVSRTSYVENPLIFHLILALDKIDPEDACRIIGDRMEHENMPDSLRLLAKGLANMADRLDPHKAEQLCARAVQVLLERSRKSDLRENLMAIIALSRHIGPEQAWIRLNALIRSDLSILDQTTANGILDAAFRLQVDELVPDMPNLIRMILSTNRDEPDVGVDVHKAYNTSILIAGLKPTEANQIARLLAFWTAQAYATDPYTFSGGSSAIAILKESLNDSNRDLRQSFRHRLREACDSFDPWLIEMALTEPYPCRLSTQDLVELLKMPTVFGEARVVVLNHLGNRYGRKFANHWQFVRYAKEHNLGLDFTTPPKRPDPKGLADRILKILDAADKD